MTENEFDNIIDFLKDKSKINDFIEVVDDLVVFFESDCDDKIDGQSYLKFKEYGIGILPNKYGGFF